MPANSASNRAKEASRTTATVLVDTHDRGQKYGGQRLDISEYVTQVSIDSHVLGGGAANVVLPAVDHFEDIIAAGDLINIYLDTHRENENIYNRGNVRVFFGYVDSVSKNTTVSGNGSKVTMYTIMCQDFGKAARQTEIYNNHHLTSQNTDGKPDVIREELKHNLAGLTLHSKGIAYGGSPLKVVLRNLMRALGMGGQWILPLNYHEGLPGSTHQVAIIPDVKENTLFDRLKESFSQLNAVVFEDQEDFNLFFKSFLEDEGIQGAGELDSNTIALIEDVFFQNKEFTPDEFFKSLDILKEQSKINGISSDLKFDARINEVNSNNINPAHRPYISNTFFKIGPAIGDDNSLDKRKIGSISTGIRPILEEIIREVATESTSVTGKFSLYPDVSHYADPVSDFNNRDAVRKALSIFNILSLDYLEQVDGNWNNWAWLNYQGNLYGALYDGANHLINELIFDLRPVATFDNSFKKDGLGVKLNGALAMVPAITLREKPFTNYPPPTKVILNEKETGSVQVGALQVSKNNDLLSENDTPVQPILKNTSSIFGSNPIKPQLEDQLYVASLAGSGGEVSIDESFLDTTEKVLLSDEKVSSLIGSLEKLEVPVGGFYKPGLHEKAKQIANIDPDGQLDITTYFGIDEDDSKSNSIEQLNQSLDNDKLKNLDPDKKKALEDIAAILDGLTSEEKSYLFAILGNSGSVKDTLYSEKLGGEITAKKFNTILSLPRPVFRSPDGTRITRERRIASSQYVLGVRTPTPGGGFSFTSFSTNSDENSVNTSAFSSSYGEKLKQDKAKFSLAAPGSDTASVQSDLRKNNSSRWHCLDFMTVYPTDVFQETHFRGDSGVVNILELTASLGVRGQEAVRFALRDVIPIITPVNIHRFGVRVQAVQTKFLQLLNLTGGASGDRSGKQYDWDVGLLMRWNILVDMWNQHNHEYISSNMAMRGMPGLRPGYRIDRPDLNLSFYVEQVSHSWTYPGYMTTNVALTRGQPTKGYKVEGNDWGLPEAFVSYVQRTSRVLPYYPPEPSVNSNSQQRQKLGQVFQVGETEKGKTRPSPGTYTGQYLRTKVKGRDAVKKWLERSFPDFKDLKKF